MQSGFISLSPPYDFLRSNPDPKGLERGSPVRLNPFAVKCGATFAGISHILVTANPHGFSWLASFLLL